MGAVIVDLSQTGLEMWLKPHEVTLMRIMWAAEGPMDNRTAWNLLENRRHIRSRATVINFLKSAADRGWLEIVQEGVRGGEGFLYVPSRDFPCEVSFRQELAMGVVRAMGDLLGVTFVVHQKRVSEESQ